MKFVGIDWASKTEHRVSVCDESGKEVAKRGFLASSVSNVRAMIEWLDEAAPLSEGRLVGIESGAWLLTTMLLEANQPLYVFNPKIVERVRDRYSVAGSKNDHFDARVIADLLRTDRGRFRQFVPDRDETLSLQLAVRARLSLVQRRAAVSVELQDELGRSYVSALSLASDITRGWVLAFLRDYPDAVSASKARRSALERLTHLKAECFEFREPIRRVLRQTVLDLVSQIELLNDQIVKADEEIERLLKEHPDGEIILSLPGARTTLAARILAGIGDDRLLYDDYSSLQALAGTAPVTRRSGKKQIVVMRRACRGLLQDSLYLLSGSSRVRSKWAREYYDRKRAEGKSGNEARRALANKWVKIIFTMLTKREPYDEERHLASLRHAGVDWLRPEADEEKKSEKKVG